MELVITNSNDKKITISNVELCVYDASKFYDFCLSESSSH